MITPATRIRLAHTTLAHIEDAVYILGELRRDMKTEEVLNFANFTHFTITSLEVKQAHQAKTMKQIIHAMEAGK